MRQFGFCMDGEVVAVDTMYLYNVSMDELYIVLLLPACMLSWYWNINYCLNVCSHLTGSEAVWLHIYTMKRRRWRQTDGDCVTKNKKKDVSRIYLPQKHGGQICMKRVRVTKWNQQSVSTQQRCYGHVVFYNGVTTNHTHIFSTFSLYHQLRQFCNLDTSTSLVFNGSQKHDIAF